MHEQISIAYLEDDPDQGQAVVRWLSKHSIDVQLFDSVSVMETALAARSFDAIILDVEIYGEPSGFNILEHVRLTEDSITPVLIVSTEKHWQKALNLGADDFLEKPLNPNKLCVHLNRILRPIYQEAAIEDYPPFQLHTAKQQIAIDGSLIDLSPAEYVLAENLIRKFGKVLSFEELMDSLVNHEESMSPKIIANRIVNLRRKLNLNAIDAWRLETVYQHGYRLVSTEYDTRAAEADRKNRNSSRT